ncbi:MULTISPECIES: RelA/SpoT family protein [Allofournierella]|uniref:GTP diphosphokinase n=1 Tax=Allofournierella massiliensis TaxID=1650663 RepID=A0ABT7UV18_9FIRM|nr:bifunctional (p)ppGpp synthetase/guanosine-3',5'-bis(diphosphate) 3'-pyrophosphohydrolase [Fournierella massiliensis]MDM8202100.1 bifunctional (p)ppGpp synthetase/guanosine-3',5'-bis(diphosphate) 3'-pyrophosphohydrolase [Fournierella massiliensis]
MAGYVVYDDLKQMVLESGRPYDMEMLDKAYQLAERAHSGQFRRSGEPYICHPLHVAMLLVDLGMDTESLAAALMHDVVEDTSVTLDELESQFGADVAHMVDGVTKLTKIKFSSVEEQQAENLRKMLMAMSQDVRVMIIKLCDRLHNMRTGDAWPEQKRRDKALETMEVYAPIAHRLGISNIKEELEDRSLWYLDPVGYQNIKDLLAENGGREFVTNIAEVIRERLAENGMPEAIMKSRVKSVYGIYRKMFMQNRDFEEIYDVYAVRIILDTVAECYNALGVIHDMYHPLPNRFKDYISTPKPNGYQSLHTTVIGHEGVPFEVQIRTREMDQMAEYGVAAHWKYKAGIQSGSSDRLEERLAWVRQLLESQRENEDAGSLLQDIKGDLLPEEVFAFTPKGDVINLPAGATAIDFAYAIHSAVGNRMIGAKVNSRIVPIDHKVVTGEIIEIITGPADKGPSRDWLKIVTTSEARNKIRNWFKKERREENIQEGRAALEREMRRNLITVPDDKWDEFMAEIARRQRLNSADEMYAALGYGGLQISRLMGKIKDEYAKLKAGDEKAANLMADIPLKKYKGSDGVVVEGIDNCPVKFAKCCSPLPGDEIVGFITRGFGVSIHKKDCQNAQASMADPENRGRWVRAYWEDTKQENYKATLELTAMDRSGLVGDVAMALTELRVPVYAMSARAVDNGRASMSLTIGIASTEHLNSVLAKLRRVKDVVSVMRV